MTKNKIISICLFTVLMFSMLSSNFSKAYENMDSTIENKSYDPFRILRTLTSDPNFISIYYMDYGAFNEPIESTKRKINSIEEVVNGKKGLYIIDRGAGWIRENDKDLIGTSGIQGSGTAKIAKSLESTFGHTVTGNLGVGIGIKNVKLGIEYSFRRFLRETDTTTIDYSMATEPGKNLYLKAYTTNRKTEIYMKPNEHQFSSLDTTYEPDGSWLKPISFEKNEKLDLNALIEKKERSILYAASHNNEPGSDQDSSVINNVKSRFLILNNQHEKLFDIAITDKNVIRILDAKDKQLDPSNPNKEYFQFRIFNKNGIERINVSLNGSDKPSEDKLKHLDEFALNNGDAIKIFHKDAEHNTIVLESTVHVGHGINMDFPIMSPIYDTILEDFYFTVNEKGLTLEPIDPLYNMNAVKEMLFSMKNNLLKIENNNQEFSESQINSGDYTNIISQSLKKDNTSNEKSLKDLILNGDYEEIVKIETDTNGNPTESKRINANNIEQKSFVPPNDGTFVINRGEGWVSSEDKNKVTTSIVPPGAISTISRSAKIQEEYIMDFNASSSFTHDFVTASLKIGAGPIMASSNTITVGGSNAINNSKHTYMKAYALNHKLEVINVTNGKITDKATVFKANGHWIVPILFDQNTGVNQKEYILSDNTKVINYDDIFDGTQIVDVDTEIIPNHMHIDTPHYQYSTDTVKSNKIAIPFTVKETGTYTVENKAIEYHYPNFPFVGLGKPYIAKYGFNFPIKIFEVDKNNLKKANSLLYEQKNITPTIGVTATLDPNKYGDPVTLKLEAGKTYLYLLDTQGKLGYGYYTSPVNGTTYTIKKGMKFIIRKK